MGKHAEKREYRFGASELHHWFLHVFPKYSSLFHDSIPMTYDKFLSRVNNLAVELGYIRSEDDVAGQEEEPQTQTYLPEYNDTGVDPEFHEDVMNAHDGWYGNCTISSRSTFEHVV